MTIREFVRCVLLRKECPPHPRAVLDWLREQEEAARREAALQLTAYRREETGNWHGDALGDRRRRSGGA